MIGTTLDKIDIHGILSKPYHRRKKCLCDQTDEIFERRYSMVHRVTLDENFDSKAMLKSIEDMLVAIDRVYKGFCGKYGWSARDYR